MTAGFYCPPKSYGKRGDPAVAMWITDTKANADALVARGKMSIALPATGWQNGNNEPLGEFENFAFNNNRLVVLAFNRGAALAFSLYPFSQLLRRRGANVKYLWLLGETADLAGANTELDVRDKIQPPPFEDEVAEGLRRQLVRDEVNPPPR